MKAYYEKSRFKISKPKFAQTDKAMFTNGFSRREV